jgi:adenylate kinase
VEAVMNRGDLVSDELVMEILTHRLAKKDCQKGYVLDGFPRNIHQARMLETLKNQHEELVLDIQVAEEELIERLSSRRICPQCGTIYNLTVKAPNQSDFCDACGAGLMQRQDDKPDVVKERLRVYREETEPMVQFFRNKENYHEIEGNKEIDMVFQEIRTVLQKEISKFDPSEAAR